MKAFKNLLKYKPGRVDVDMDSTVVEMVSNDAVPW